MADKHVIVVGAGPGGLAAAMLLAHDGLKVTVLEREQVVGGRNARLDLGPYRFDTGPTFLMMTFLLRTIFEKAGRRLDEYCSLVPLDPMYRLTFRDLVMNPTTDRKEMQARIDAIFPGNEGAVERFDAREALRFRYMYPCLEKDYSSPGSMLSMPLIRALPHLALGRSLYGVLSGYFAQEDLRIAHTFQAKYLGMSPWECPGAFVMIPHVEHAYGIDHVLGGLCRIPEAMAEVAVEHGADIRLSTEVGRILVDRGRVTGVETIGGERIGCDALVLNADFGHAMDTLFEPGVIRKYTPARLRRMKYSCSTFMLYLGLSRLYDEPHHNIIFADDYRRNIAEVVGGGPPSADISLYIRNASVTDPSLAPDGHSAVYVLVPVPNNLAGIEWTEDEVFDFRQRVLERIAARTSMTDIGTRIAAERIITPRDWQRRYGVFLGATFNLGHNMRQMLYFRPRNRFEEVRGVYLAGGGTHPGSGLPTIFESARISSRLLERDLGRRT